MFFRTSKKFLRISAMACSASLFVVILCVSCALPATCRTDPGEVISSNTTRTDDSELISTRASSASCSPPAIESFPTPFFGPEVRARGAVVIHVAIAACMVVFVYVLLTKFFNPAADIIVERLGVDPEIAGGTFLAAAGSIPSLVSSIIGLNVAQTDEALSSTLGSGVLKAAGVFAIAALFSTGAVKVNVWSAIRSYSCYLVSLLLIVLIGLDERIEWIEALACLILYVLYVAAMLFHESLRSVCHCLLPCLFPEPGTVRDAEDPVAKDTVVIDLGEPTEGGPQAPADPSSKEQALKKMTATFLRPFESALIFVIPDCGRPETAKFFMVTFALSGLLIATASYVLVWMLAVVGFTLGIPESVLAMTLMSISGALPDIISCVLALREGLGNMAFSCLIGANIFDLLFGLGLPWLLQTSTLNPELPIKLLSQSLIYPLMGLLATILLLPVLTVVCRWRINKVFGSVLLAWYFAFVMAACLYQQNFAENLPTCPSSL